MELGQRKELCNVPAELTFSLVEGPILITLVNKLQDIFNATNSEKVKLPQIVVIGPQSCGKSSLMESLVGHPFLPKGVGLVTRSPIVIQIINISDSEAEYGVWCEFLHDPGTKYEVDEVKDEIIAQTLRLAGDDNGISHEEINLKVFSNRAVQLTLVDLPGIVKIPSGNQPENIETLIHDLYMKYVSNENSIILAVSAAENDIVNSDGLKIAKEVDPHGRRTLAVITKLDLMNKGTNARDLLTSRDIPAKLGIIGVVNRSQQDILDGKTIQEGIDDEEDFLDVNYPTLAASNGMPYLIKRLEKILLDHIKNCLPDLEKRINELLRKARADVEALGPTISPDDQSKELLRILTKFASNYKASIDGTSRHLDTDHVPGSVRIVHVFENVFAKDLKAVDPITSLTQKDILIAIRRSGGTESKFIIPEVAFRDLVKTQIKRLEAPALNCSVHIDMEMKNIIDICLTQMETEMVKFPRLKFAIVTFVKDMLRQRLDVVQAMLRTYVNIEASYVATNQEKFNSDEKDQLNAMDVAGAQINGEQIKLETGEISVDGALNAKQQNQCQIVEGLMTSYFKLIKEMFQDHVPKAVMYTVVYYVADNILSELISNIYSSKDIGELFSESEEIQKRREQSNAFLQVLEKASRFMDEVR